MPIAQPPHVYGETNPLMKTIFSIVLLIVFGAVAQFLCSILLNIAGLPGALLSGTPGKRSKQQFNFGSIVAALGQSYVYLAYMAFIVNWTMKATRRDDVPLGLVLWPVAFCRSCRAYLDNWIRGRVEAKEVMQQTGFASPQVEGLQYTVLLTFISFFVFAFIPRVMSAAWGWVPYID